MSGLSAGDARVLGARAISSLGYGFAAVCAPAIILSPIFFRYWIGGEFALHAAPVNSLPWRVDQRARFPSPYAHSKPGPPDVLTGCMIEIVPFLVILWILTSTLGINGIRDRLERALRRGDVLLGIRIAEARRAVRAAPGRASRGERGHRVACRIQTGSRAPGRSRGCWSRSVLR